MSKNIRDLILNSSIPEETVDIPEWGVTVLIRGLMAAESIDFYESVSSRQSDGTFRVDQKKWTTGLLLACVYDPETKVKVFDRADAEEIGRKSALVVTRIAGIAARLSGLTAEEEAVEDFDEAH